MNTDFFWSSYIMGVSFGDINPKHSFTFSEGYVYTIFQTGSPFIQVPTKYFNHILEKIMAGAFNPLYRITGGKVYSTCESFKPLYFMFDNYWIKIDPEEYLQDVSPYKDRSACLMLI